MRVPEEIRAIERPRNTIVVPSNNGKVYAVRERAGTKRVGKRSLPINGHVIGHIINGKYVPLKKDRVEQIQKESNEEIELINCTKKSDLKADTPENIESPELKITEKKNSISNASTVTVTLTLPKDIAQSLISPLLTLTSQYAEHKETEPNDSHSLNITLAFDKNKEISDCYDILDWGIIQFAHQHWQKLQTDLLSCYGNEDVHMIATMALLRACYNGISDCDLKDKYYNSVLPYIYPNVSIEKDNVHNFLEALGRRLSQIFSFMRLRTAEINEFEPIFIDGMLKSDISINHPSEVLEEDNNSVSADIFVMLLYTSENLEPNCSMCFSTENTEASIYDRFLFVNNVEKGILCGDKNYPYALAKNWFKSHPRLHFLLPLKNKNKYTVKYHLHDYEDTLQTLDYVMSKKVYNEEDKFWIYSFHNTKICNSESQNCINFNDDITLYGTKAIETLNYFKNIDIISDLNLPCDKVYEMWTSRLKAEFNLSYYKMGLSTGQAYEQNDPSIIGSEFINFLAHIINIRINNTFDTSGVLSITRTFDAAREVLSSSQIYRPFAMGPWVLKSQSNRQLEILQKLNLIDAYGDIIPYNKIPKILNKNPYSKFINNV